jgi:hypothetical protein
VIENARTSPVSNLPCRLLSNISIELRTVPKIHVKRAERDARRTIYTSFHHPSHPALPFPVSPPTSATMAPYPASITGIVVAVEPSDRVPTTLPAPRLGQPLLFAALITALAITAIVLSAALLFHYYRLRQILNERDLPTFGTSVRQPGRRVDQLEPSPPAEVLFSPPPLGGRHADIHLHFFLDAEADPRRQGIARSRNALLRSS